MSKKKHMVPFKWLPASWGLTGKMRDVAQAEYELEGEELERRLVDINLQGLDEKRVQLAKLELDRKYNKITDEQLDRSKVELNIEGKDAKALELAMLDLDKKYGKITESEYENKKATAIDEPFVRVARIITDPNDPAFGGIILDWNKAFVVHLESHGYGPYPTDEETVNEWFNELCKNIALEAFDGQGDFSEKVDEAMQAPTRRMQSDVIKSVPTSVSRPSRKDKE